MGRINWASPRSRQLLSSGGEKWINFHFNRSLPPSSKCLSRCWADRASRLRTALPLTVHSNPFSSLVSRGKKRIVKLYRTKRRGEREERFKCRFRQKVDSKVALDRLRGGSPNLGIRELFIKIVLIFCVLPLSTQVSSLQRIVHKRRLALRQVFV